MTETGLYKLFRKYIDNELLVARSLFLLTGFVFTAFAFQGLNEQLRGPIPHHNMLNWVDGLVALLCFSYITISETGKTKYQEAGYALIYTLNIVNVYLLYGTAFSDIYAYQFLVVYVVSSWFFRKERPLFIHTLVINLLFLLVSFSSKENNSSIFDFYTTYIFGSFCMIVLMRYRFSVEEKLLESEKRYRLIAENSFDLICIHNRSGDLEFVSPSVKRLLGYTPEEFGNGKPWGGMHPDDVYKMKAVRFEAGHASLSHPIQYRILTTGGQYIWVETVFTLLESPDGQTNFAMSQTRSVNRSKLYQLQLEERSQELMRSNQDLETFAYVSSHDMQEPLRMIASFMQLLKKKYGHALNQEATEYADFAYTGAVNLQRLITDLLSFARISRAEMKREDVDMDVLMKEVTDGISMLVQEKHAVVKWNGNGCIRCDRSMAKLVMQNLVLNGIKYNRSSTPTVQVNYTRKNGRVEVSVTDNGIGIPSDQQHRIFEPFHRLHTRSEYPGTGLGLAICKKVMDRSGGSISVQSTEGSGATFFLSFAAAE